jgi:multiple sugar transport system substrate-binding protein
MLKIRGFSQHTLRLIALALVAAIFAACAAPVAPAPAAPEGQAEEQAAGEAAPAAEGSAAEGGAVEVVFWNQHSNPVDVAAIEQIVSDFNAANPDVSVTIVPVPGDETDVTKLMTAVRGGTGPDVYLFNRPFIAERAATGILTDITDFVEADNLLEQYLPFTRQEITYKDRVYGLPFDTDVRALYYNRTLLEEAGVDLAEFDPANGPISLERVTEIAQLLDETDESGAYTRIGFIPWLDQGWHYTWGYAFGGSFYDSAGCAVTPTDENVVAAFQFLYDWAQRMGADKVQTFRDTYMPVGAPPETHPFLTGRVAMTVSGDWTLAQIEQFAPDLDYGVTYIPVPEGNPVTSWSAGWSLVIPSGAKQPEAAYRFMKYMTGPDGQRVYVQMTKHLPTWASLLEETELFEGDHQFLRGLLPESASLPPVPAGAAYWDALTTAQEQVTLNVQEPAAALQEVIDRMQPILAPLCQ